MERAGARVAPTVRLPHGAVMPRLGLGTARMDDSESEEAVATAISLGYRLFDTAHAYGNEAGVGRGLRAGGVSRERLFVTSKLNAEWHGRRRAHEAFEISVDRLGLDYLDLFLIHWPNPGRDRYVEAYAGLVELLEAGRVRAIGLSNFKPSHIERVLEATGVVPDVNQIELDPTVARPQPRAYHARRGIVTESWSPLGRGGELLSRPEITEAAERHGRTPAQIVLRWHMELGLVAIPKSSDPVHMRENLDIFDFSLASAEVQRISSLDRGESAATDSDAFGH